jgi:hypothetical protein
MASPGGFQNPNIIMSGGSKGGFGGN